MNNSDFSNQKINLEKLQQLLSTCFVKALSLVMSHRGKCIFTEEYPYLESVAGNPSAVFCTHCKIEISLKNKGKYDIQQHVNTQKHKKNSSLKTSKKLLRYFHKSTSSMKEANARLFRIELTFCYHNVLHNFSFRSMDCTSKLLKKCIEPKIG